MNKIKTEADLNRLVEAGTPEGRHLEYKSALYVADESAKGKNPRNELAKDVSAFANADGGEILIGMAEGKNNAAPKIIGVDCDADKEILRMGQIIRDNIAPPIPGLPPIADIPLASGKRVLAIDIPSSIRKPHQVVKTGIFYARQATEVQRLNVDELRPMFIGAETLMARTEAFRHERVDRFLAGEEEIKPHENGAAMIHVIPLTIWPMGRIDLRDVESHFDFAPHEMGCEIGSAPRPCFRRTEYAAMRHGMLHCRQILFDDGVVEFTARDILGSVRMFLGDPQIPALPPEWDRHMRPHFRKILRGFSEAGVAPPFCAMMSLLGVSGSVLVLPHPNRSPGDKEGRCCQEDRLLLPPVTLDGLENHGESESAQTREEPFKQWCDGIASAYHWREWPHRANER